MSRHRLLTLAALPLVVVSFIPFTLAAQTGVPTLTPQNSGTMNRLQAISPVNSRVAWASGVAGTFVVTTDGGATWRAGVVPGAEALQFRDVQGVSENEAFLMSAGTGTDSRIYKTEDGGATWQLQFENEIPLAFYDCFAFWGPDRGLATSDSVAGVFPALLTENGDTWRNIGEDLPVALPGESSFAASGTCVAVQGERRAWIATGGAVKARILATTDGGETWAAYDTPIVQGTGLSGIFSVDFRDARHGILGGGDLAAPTAFTNNVARSHDGGKTWRLAQHPTFTGAIYGLSYVRTVGRHKNDDGKERGEQEKYERAVVATGPGGASWTPDEGETWYSIPGAMDYWAVAFGSPDAGWLVGTNGRILKISF